MALRWPADFPEDCPPEEATLANGVYYYIVKNDPPERSAISYRYIAETGNYGPCDMSKAAIVTECQTMGLSVFADQTMPWRERRQYHRSWG